MSTKRWILVFFGIILLCAAMLVFRSRNSSSDTVVVTSDGTTICTLNLSEVDVPYSFTVDYHGSTNTIQITQETVWVSHADCSNQVCVDHGPLLPDGSPITCLPNRLIIQWADSAVDG